MTEIVLENPELQMLINNKASGFKYRERREEDWRENYELYRDRVQVNRLLQRQSVNLPLMKTTLRTLLKDIDDMPVIEFENLDNDKEAQVFQNEFWKKTLDDNNAEIQDIVDKKQDFFFGRTFDSWQIIDGKMKWDIEDPEDILVSRFMNPYDIDSSRFLIHTHIFKPLSHVMQNPDYDKMELSKLKQFFESKMGIIKAIDNENSLQEKNQKMADMGVSDVDDPVLGETYVELTLHYVFRNAEKVGGKEIPEQIWVYVEAENQVILMKKPQEEIIGTTVDHFWRNHYRYNTWGDDIDKQDFWTDGIADIVRVPNKIQNAWFSQEVERRTLSNFGMTFYNSSSKAEGFMPNTFQPQAFGFYPFPGDPNKDLRRVEIPMNDGNLEAITFVSEFAEKATGATPGQQGITPPSGTPLGTTQIVEGEAKARTQGISKFYTKAWEQRGLKFLKMIEAGADKIDAVKIYKEGRNTDNVFAREISPKDWMTKSGYRVKVWSQDEKNSQDVKSIQKLQAVKLAMPMNPKLNEVYNRKLLEFADLTPDEVTEIMDTEKMMLTNPMAGVNNNGTGTITPTQPVQPAQPAQPAQPIQ
jgi:hypothetical protein